MKLTIATVITAFLTSCSSSTTPAPINMGPVGDGLSVIGYSLIAVAVVATLGRLLR